MVKATSTSLPDNIGTRIARALGAKSRAPDAAPRTSMPVATHPADGGANGKCINGSLRSALATAALPMPPAASTARQWRPRQSRSDVDLPPWRKAPIPTVTPSHHASSFSRAWLNGGKGDLHPSPRKPRSAPFRFARMRIVGIGCGQYFTTLSHGVWAPAAAVTWAPG